MDFAYHLGGPAGPMITRFRLENFKGHRDTDLALQPFTVLVGDNGSGKTSVLEPGSDHGLLEHSCAATVIKF